MLTSPQVVVAEEWTGEEGVALGSVLAMRKLSGARILDGELTVTLRMQNNSGLAKILEVRDRVPEVMRIKEGSNYILMELGPRRETYIEYTLECPLRGFYSIGPVAVEYKIRSACFTRKKKCMSTTISLCSRRWRISKGLCQIPCSEDFYWRCQHSPTWSRF